jgi:hypothetical protein
VTSPPSPNQRPTLEAYFFALVVFISATSLASVGLLSLGLFTPGVTLTAAAASLCPALFFLKRTQVAKKLNRSEWAVLALVLVAFALRWNTSVYVYGGQDPGVYTNVASHFAEHGSWIIKDHLLDEFEGRKDLRDYYVANSIRRTVQNEAGGWYGNMLPGIYLQDLDRNEWVSQFYHVNTTWLAIGQWMFGIELKGLTLAFLSSLSIIAAYLIALRVSGSPVAGLIAAFLLATNAAHSYIGTFPVSEAVAGFFFLSALAMLTAGWQFLSILPFSALFLTRITGFLTMPLLLISLAWMAVKRRDTRAAWTGLGILGAYALSVMWGLTFSAPYSRDIYRGKLGIPPSLLEHAPTTFIAIGVVWVVGCLCATRFRNVWKPLCIRLVRHRTALCFVIAALVLVAVGFRGYLLAFTDHYAQHRWFGRRWDMAAHGIDSLKYLSFYSLTMMLSPVVLLAFIVGLVLLGRIAIKRAIFAPVAVCTLGFFAALTIKQLTTPYLYYFGRYLVSELLPLAIVCAAVALYSLTRLLPRFRAIAIVLYCTGVFVLLYPSLQARLRIREGHQFFEAMSCINEATPGRSVIFVDKNSFAETPVVTALRFSFQKPTFALRETDFSQPEKLQDLVDFFQAKGFTVYLLSSGEGWNSKGGFTKIMRISAIMRTIGGRAEAPTQMRTRAHPLRLYSLEKSSTLPEICQKVIGYSR